MYLIRLDDASEYMDIKKWNRVEIILDKYNIKPIVGIIPKNKDYTMTSLYKKNTSFWSDVLNWEKKNWIIAMHGYEHIYCSNSGGINPIHNRSEFAGLSLEEQRKKIQSGYKILTSKGITPKVFFAPSHTFDNNTLEAIKLDTNIRIISDTIASRVYYHNDLYFIPQQSGKVRTIPFKIVTFCYHPNTMNNNDFTELERFISNNNNKFVSFSEIEFIKKDKNLFDNILSKLYFLRRRKK